MIRILLPLLMLPGVGLAEDAPTHPEILACVAAMETDDEWATCRTMMFASCAEHPAGSDDHVACLASDRESWRGDLELATGDVTQALTAEGATELGQLLTQWFGYVGQKCAAVGAERAAISEAAARLGCEISETVGLVAELNACTVGASTAPYCIRKAE